MKFWSAPSLAILAALTTSGCATYGQHGYGHYGHTRHTSGGGEAVALGIGLLAGAALASSANHHPEPEERVIVTQQIYYVNAQPAPALPPSTRDRVPLDYALPSFDAASARSALAATDVTSCEPAGAAAGYGHVPRAAGGSVSPRTSPRTARGRCLPWGRSARRAGRGSAAPR